MKRVQRWRYYCDHCKKVGGSGWHMAKHERGCTGNPNRQCGVCREGLADARPLNELISLCIEKSTAHHDELTGFDWRTLSKEGLAELRSAAGGCPACMLAAMRQSRAFPHESLEWKFKDEMAEFWKDYNEEKEEQW